MTILTKTLLVAALLTSTAWVVAVAGAAQIQRPPTTPLVIKSTYGADLYQFYCSSCHGSTGRGVSARSGTPPPDLTGLARANGGVFPRDRVRSTITFGKGATEIGAHGKAEMPVWGTIFRGLDPSDTMTEIRIENLVNFIETLQARTLAEDHRR
jgi:mono/diheme cytochrome c family protein